MSCSERLYLGQAQIHVPHEIVNGVFADINMGRRMTATHLFMRAKCLLEKRVNEWETIESFIIPVLIYLGWPVTYFGHRVKLYRNSSSDFDLIFAKGSNILLAVEAKRISTNILATSANKASESASNCSLPVQVATYASMRGRSQFRLDKNYTRVLWTNGVHWIQFKDCIKGTLTDQYKTEISRLFKLLKKEGAQGNEVSAHFKKITLLEKNTRVWSEEIFYQRLEDIKSLIGHQQVWHDYQAAQQNIEGRQ